MIDDLPSHQAYKTTDEKQRTASLYKVRNRPSQQYNGPIHEYFKLCGGAMLTGDRCAELCNGVRAVCCKISHVRRNNHRKLLGGCCVYTCITGLPCAQLGSSSTHHQPSWASDYTALLVLYTNDYTSASVANAPTQGAASFFITVYA